MLAQIYMKIVGYIMYISKLDLLEGHLKYSNDADLEILWGALAEQSSSGDSVWSLPSETQVLFPKATDKLLVREAYGHLYEVVTDRKSRRLKKSEPSNAWPNISGSLHLAKFECYLQKSNSDASTMLFPLKTLIWVLKNFGANLFDSQCFSLVY